MPVLLLTGNKKMCRFMAVVHLLDIIIFHFKGSIVLSLYFENGKSLFISNTFIKDIQKL